MPVLQHRIVYWGAVPSLPGQLWGCTTAKPSAEGQLERVQT